MGNQSARVPHQNHVFTRGPTNVLKNKRIQLHARIAMSMKCRIRCPDMAGPRQRRGANRRDVHG